MDVSRGTVNNWVGGCWGWKWSAGGCGGCCERGTRSYLTWEDRVGGLEGQMEADEWLWPPLERNSPKEKNKDSSGVWWTAWSLSPHTPELQHFSKNICMPCTFDFRLLQCFQKWQGLSPAPWIAVAAWWWSFFGGNWIFHKLADRELAGSPLDHTVIQLVKSWLDGCWRDAQFLSYIVQKRMTTRCFRFQCAGCLSTSSQWLRSQRAVSNAI